MDLYEELKRLRWGVDRLQGLATDVTNHTLRQELMDCAAELSTWVEAIAEKCDLDAEDDDSDLEDSDLGDSDLEPLDEGDE